MQGIQQITEKQTTGGVEKKNSEHPLRNECFDEKQVRGRRGTSQAGSRSEDQAKDDEEGGGPCDDVMKLRNSVAYTDRHAF
ncbi:hypothetical protein RUM44_010475 [Polyplax serrata]|uniref:Uncharacterized protein n=1 Tax=Polyplax serrata TaxID=468196 RepID=A0ABR1AVZ2_POLSC